MQQLNIKPICNYVSYTYCARYFYYDFHIYEYVSYNYESDQNRILRKIPINKFVSVEKEANESLDVNIDTINYDWHKNQSLIDLYDVINANNYIYSIISKYIKILNRLNKIKNLI